MTRYFLWLWNLEAVTVVKESAVKMKHLLTFLLSLSLIFGFLPLAAAGNIFQQAVNVQVECRGEIGVSGDPPSLVISTAEAGTPTDPLHDDSTTLSLTATCAGQTLVWTDTVSAGHCYMPGRTYLAIKVGPISAQATDYQQLGAGSWRSIAAFDAGTRDNKRICYKFSADPDVSLMSDSINAVLLVTGLC